MSPYWAGLAVACVAGVFGVLLLALTARERRQRDGCGLCRRWEPVDCSCPRRCTALVCPRKEGTR